MRAIILAAGQGTRLVSGRPYPKPLQPVAGVPLIVHVLQRLGDGGVTDVAVVVGYRGGMIREALTSKSLPTRLHFFDNPQWHLPNGNSLLAARAFVTEPTFLVMSDHLWTPALLQRVADAPLNPNGALLGVDYDIPGCFDLPDATKVRVDGTRIVEIGKELPTYDCLDTGVFRITRALLNALEAANGPDGCSLSAGVGTLAERGLMHVADVEDATWLDVDTPEALAEAERRIAKGSL
ncbi:MAG: NTP transferase domain-containing protein [Myxococcota bacterium]